MSAELYAAFLAACVVLVLVPGPTVTLTLANSLKHGTRAGLLTTLGVSTGLCMYATLSLLGLSAILAEYQWLTWTVRVLGGCYLAWLGIKLLRAKPQTIDLDRQPMRPDGKRAILFGFLVTLTNPKAIVLFASVFATAVTASTPTWLMVLMIGLVTASSLVWYSCVSLFMSSGPVMRRFQNARHWIERAAGVCFIGLGGKVLADAGRPIS